MSNKHIAINWAITTVKNASGFVYSDQFFRPFTNQSTRKKIRQELEKRNILVWGLAKDGALLFRANDPRLKVHIENGYRVGTWTEGENIMILNTDAVV
jgi:hypothetical protein